MLVTCCITVFCCVVAILCYFKWKYQYWAKRNVPFIKPRFPFGNMENPGKRTMSLGDRIKLYYQYFKMLGTKHAGTFIMAKPCYLAMDLDYIKLILTKDFCNFSHRGIYYNERDDPVSAHLFFLGGKKWRLVRTKLTPTFTTGKIKAMFSSVVQVAQNLENHLTNLPKQDPIDIKDILTKYSTDIIGSCAFGLDCNSFQEPNSQFRVICRRAFRGSKPELARTMFSITYPEIARFLRFPQLNKEVSRFFLDVVFKTINFRRTNQVYRRDFLQILMDEINLSIPEIAAQSFGFFAAGFETTSSAIAFGLAELAANQVIQNKVREEINEVLKKKNGEISYESIGEMTYLHQVVCETLRKYPAVPFITRTCQENYSLPDGLVIEKGINVIVPILGIHFDEDLYPDPEKFDPERFSKDNQINRHQYAFLPFGEGPRICIGMRFGLLNTKMGLIYMLKNFKYSLNEKTKLPIKMARNSFIHMAEDPIFLDYTKIH